MSDVPTRVYPGEGIEVLWFPQRCIHSARCVRGLPEVFDFDARPWVQTGNVADGRIAATVETCPSGALQYRRTDGAPQEQPAEPAELTPVADGPLYLRGALRIEGASGQLIRDDTRIALCRCGHSGNIPFCDNSHRRIGFSAPAGIAPSVAPPLQQDESEVTTMAQAPQSDDKPAVRINLNRPQAPSRPSDAEIDEAVEESFPASDPPPGPTNLGGDLPDNRR